MAILLDGSKIRDEIRGDLKARVARLSFKPKLSILSAGDNPSQAVYIRQKKIFGEAIGVDVIVDNVSETEIDSLLPIIDKINANEDVQGAIVQMPVPDSDPRRFLNMISAQKDLDALSDISLGRILSGDKNARLPATPRGIIHLLRHYAISLRGKNVLIIGRSVLVGRSLAAALISEDATVTVAHSKSENVGLQIEHADIVVSAVGIRNFITEDHVKKHQVIVDVGINSFDDTGGDTKRKIVGDVAFDEVREIVSAISPVPSGVGPMTVASLFLNLIEECERKDGK